MTITAIKSNSKSKDKRQIRKQFDQFIIEQGHPCVMAQTMFRMDKVDMHVYPDFGSEDTAESILNDLQQYLDNYDFETDDFYTFIAVFDIKDPDLSEKQFEELLWRQLQHLHEADDQPWDKQVSNDPADKEFSFSLLNQAFYIVGMHPNSSRRSRRSPYPAMVFNLHWQFQKLRERGVYEQVRNTIRERDKEFDDGINPMLDDFGNRSEARQYSGRQVDDSWECPFHHK